MIYLYFIAGFITFCMSYILYENPDDLKTQSGSDKAIIFVVVLLLAALWPATVGIWLLWQLRRICITLEWEDDE